MQARSQITVVTDATDRLREALDEHKTKTGQGQKEVATAAGYKAQSTISNALARGSLPKNLARLAKILDVRLEWIESGIPPKRVAHQVSPDTVKVAPQRPDSPVVKWRGMQAEELPGVFRVPAPDDAMADRVRRGWLVEFDRSLKPQQDDGVLVEDREKRWFFRLYSEGSQGRFEALPLNPAYQKLESERDGLRVIAVLIGIPTRWNNS